VLVARDESAIREELVRCSLVVVAWSSVDAAISSDVIVVRSPYVLLAISVDFIAVKSTADVAL
jgi:hypothetical protein